MTASRDKIYNGLKHRVAVTGMGIITTLGAGKKKNLSGILEGQNAIKEITSFDVSGYRSKIGGAISNFNFSKKLKQLQSSRLDRATKLLLTALDEAVAEAGFANGLPSHTPLILGTTLGGMLSGEAYHRNVVFGKKAKPSLLLDYLAHYQAIHIAEEYGLHGAAFTISNACASGTNAIGLAYHEIGAGNVEIALAGGYDTMCEFTFAGFNSLQALTQTLCRPFDKNRDGLVLGEGAGIIVLEELSHAVSRNANILTEIIGYGESSDAFHITRPDPSGDGAALAISRALDSAGVNASAIDYINAHGTGTPYNDVMEAKAIQKVFGSASKNIPLSSVKSMIGHLLGGAGAVEAIITIMAMNKGVLPPNINYETPDPDCPLNIVERLGQKAFIKRAMSNSFGFGGANAALVFQNTNV
ncbi:MAG: beta-ketoacyl-[acyl-carrier-protein] synthase family protein [Deltaproteobacteria bacterium]|nr:beta-ketoacyl-[acyl-carrier-protein] synthase family protein [Deltaproteobacteria bacterium]